MLTVNFISHRRSQARFWDTLGSRECSSGIVNQALRSKSWHFPYEDPQTRIFTKQPCNSIQSGRKTMNYEDKCIKGAWNWSVFPQITAWLSNPAPTPFQEQTYTHIHSHHCKEEPWVLGQKKKKNSCNLKKILKLTKDNILIENRICISSNFTV